MHRFAGWLAAASLTLLLFPLTTPTAVAGCPDIDADGVCDEVDNCPFDPNPDQIDTDADGEGDVCDDDDDNDGVVDPEDFDPLNPFVCRDVDADTCDDCSSGTDDPSNDGLDFDGDGLCDLGDPDDDNDGIPDAADPCPLDPTNSCVCPDADGDGVCDEADNCPFIFNPEQDDADEDGLGDVCDECTDTDGDGCGDPGYPANTCCSDNCPQAYNPGQEDADGDGIGDICDPCPNDPTNTCGCPDIDADGICDDDDNCPFMANPSQEDVDADGVGDLCDNCPSDANPDQSDIDEDGIGDVCDPCPEDPTNACCDDTDGDSICDELDNCPLVHNPDQADTDDDGLGDACDADDDNDGVPDAEDADPLNPFVCRDVDADTCDDCSSGTDDPANDGPDFDEDGMCDQGDPDDDDDGIPDAADPCPHDPTNTCECDDADSDGICDGDDNCPFVHNPDQADTDGDGLGDVCDPCPYDPANDCVPCSDVDGDGICDENDNCPFVVNPDQSDVDGDGIGDACDPCPEDPANVCVPICTRLPAMAHSWWPGDGHERDIVGESSPTTTIGTPTFVPAYVLEGVKFGGQDGFVVPDTLGLNLREFVSASILTWVRVDSLPDEGSAAIVDKRAGEESSLVGYLLYAASPDDGRSDTATIRFRMSDGSSVQELVTGPVAHGTYHHVAVVVDRYLGTVTIYLNGERQDTQLESVGDLTNGSEFHIGHPTPASVTEVLPLDGVIDELQFFGRAVSSCEVQAIYKAQTGGACRDDADSDAVVDYEDNCSLIANPAQANQDHDPAGDLCDCRPPLSGVFWVPGEAGGLVLGADLVKDRLGWCPHDFESGSETVFTVVRGLLSELPIGTGESEVCLASAQHDIRLTDSSTPLVNEGLWYVLRATNGCGVGTYGFNSEGSERGGPILESCPTSEAELCHETGGWWDIDSCGHYWCGQFPDCDAIIPGCDCGPGRNFVPGLGCVDDEDCP